MRVLVADHEDACMCPQTKTTELKSILLILFPERINKKEEENSK